jgi:hypothetical protein
VLRKAANVPREDRREFVTLDEFVKSRGVDLPAIAHEVDRAVGLQPEDTLVAVGSLVEGLGTTRSDLDLLLLTRRPGRVTTNEIPLVVGRCLVDMRVLRFAEMEALFARLLEWSRQPWDVIGAAGFTHEERVLLHRLCHARSVLDRRQNAFTLEVASVSQSLALLKLHVARHLSRTIQVDMAGHRDAGDYRSMVFAAQEVLGHAVDALVAGYGLTNPLPKWRSRLLDLVPEDWERFLAVRPSRMAAGERIWNLYRPPERPTADTAVQYALQVIIFARAVFAWAQRRFTRDLAPSSREYRWPSPSRSASVASAALDIDVDFLLADDGAAILGRLNAFGKTEVLTDAELDVALLSDGLTTSDEIEAVVRASHNDAAFSAETAFRKLDAAEFTVKMPAA